MIGWLPKDQLPPTQKGEDDGQEGEATDHKRDQEQDSPDAVSLAHPDLQAKSRHLAMEPFPAYHPGTSGAGGPCRSGARNKLLFGEGLCLYRSVSGPLPWEDRGRQTVSQPLTAKLAPHGVEVSESPGPQGKGERAGALVPERPPSKRSSPSRSRLKK